MRELKMDNGRVVGADEIPPGIRTLLDEDLSESELEILKAAILNNYSSLAEDAEAEWVETTGEGTDGD